MIFLFYRKSNRKMLNQSIATIYFFTCGKIFVSLQLFYALTKVVKKKTKKNIDYEQNEKHT